MSAAGGTRGPGAVVRQGHLRKLKTMKKKYFVLRDDTPECSARLEYYESEKKFRAGAMPRRVLPLKSCYNIVRRLDLKQRHVIALFTREEQFCVVAENEQELHAWLAAVLKLHRSDDASEELKHPIQHVWQVNVQKKGLGASKNIQGLYNLCLTDKTLTLVKIKSHNNVISDLGIPERVEYSLKCIRRCGDSECFFYMEVGRQTVTGAGELWMHSDDANIAQSMHSTILHAMRNCAKEMENEKDHIIIPKATPVIESSNPLPARRQTYSDARGRAGLANAENQPPNNSLTNEKQEHRPIKHHRTVSLPGGPFYKEPLRIVHERTRSAPLTGDELDRAIIEKVTSQSCKAVNGAEFGKKNHWSRRASTGTRLSKLSPAHSKNSTTLRNRCDSMPARASSSFEIERPAQRHDMIEGMDVSRDETDAMSEWHRTPRIPEEPDVVDIANRDFFNGLRGSICHSRTASLTADESVDGYLCMAPPSRRSASSGSVASGTPSTDPRFSEYQLEPATSHLCSGWRSTRAYSVGSRPAPRAPPRHRAYSAGAGARPARAPHDLMELDFSPHAKVTVVSRTPPTVGFVEPRPVPKPKVDEYVDMSPRNAGYVEMRPGELPSPSLLPVTPLPASLPASFTTPAPATTPDGYVEMNYSRSNTRPIAISSPRPPPNLASSPDTRRRREARTPLGSQTIFPLSLDSPASPLEQESEVFDEESQHHPLTTVREISEECGRKSPESPRTPTEPKVQEVSCSPQYVLLAAGVGRGRAGSCKTPEPETDELSCNPTANKTIVRAGDGDVKGETSATVVVANSGTAARFAVEPGPLHYAALDLEPRRTPSAPAPRHYTQIDFARSDQLHAADGN